MRVTPGERRVSLSIGEFSEFRLGPSLDTYGTRALWRAQLGTAWHKEMESRTRQEYPDARFEVPIKGIWKHRGWNIELQGRIDQLI